MPSERNFSSIIDTVNKDADVPKLYANDFLAALGLTDITLLLYQNGATKALVNMPFGTAKKLQSFLAEMIEEYEEMSKSKIPHPNDLADEFPDDDESHDEGEQTA